MKKTMIFSMLGVLCVTMIFAFNVEIGAGMSKMNSSSFPTASIAMGIPTFENTYLTGQFNVIFLHSFRGKNSTAFTLLGGLKYDLKMHGINVFLGMDGGMITNFEGIFNAPIVGVNASINFSIFYAKAAIRWISVNLNSNDAVGFFLGLTELTAGLELNY